MAARLQENYCRADGTSREALFVQSTYLHDGRSVLHACYQHSCWALSAGVQETCLPLFAGPTLGQRGVWQGKREITEQLSVPAANQGSL